MRIRHSAENDFDRMMEIYRYARKYMAEHGNPNQWGPTNWPPEALIRSDIRSGNSYVCLSDEGKVIGTFYFIQGKDIEPTYRNITEGAWLDSSPYGVVHRIAGDGSEKGIGAFCINWAFEQCGHLRIDTHGDNTVMQNLVKKLGFVRCGTIYVEEDSYPRLAFEKTAGGPAPSGRPAPEPSGDQPLSIKKPEEKEPAGKPEKENHMKKDDLVSRLTDDQVEQVTGGSVSIHVDYVAENEYCPFCNSYHEIVHCQEGRIFPKGTFPLLYCRRSGHYFVSAKNGYFDWNGNLIW